MKIKNLINKIKLIIYPFIRPSEYNHSFTLAFLLSYFDLNIPNEAAPIVHYSSGI